MEALTTEQLKDEIQQQRFIDGRWCLMYQDAIINTCTPDDRPSNPHCHECKERFSKRQGALIPKELQGTKFERMFGVWKNFQHIEYNHITGRYTDQQVEQVRQGYTDYLLGVLAKKKEQQAEAKKNQDILNKLFGGSE